MNAKKIIELSQSKEIIKEVMDTVKYMVLDDMRYSHDSDLATFICTRILEMNSDYGVYYLSEEVAQYFTGDDSEYFRISDKNKYCLKRNQAYVKYCEKKGLSGYELFELPVFALILSNHSKNLKDYANRMIDKYRRIVNHKKAA